MPKQSELDHFKKQLATVDATIARLQAQVLSSRQQKQQETPSAHTQSLPAQQGGTNGRRESKESQAHPAAALTPPYRHPV